MVDETLEWRWHQIRLAFPQPGRLLCSLPLSLPRARTWEPVLQGCVSHPDFEGDKGGGRRGQWGRGHPSLRSAKNHSSFAVLELG